MIIKKRVVFKKGRYVTTRQGQFVINLSKKIYNELKPLSKRIKIAGSIRRNNPKPVDIDIVLIPKNRQNIVEYLKTKGKFIQGGDKRSTFKIQGVKVEIYYTTPGSWGAALMSYTGPSGSSIGLRILARKKGYLLNQYGLFNKKDKRFITGKTEKSIYNALGKKYKAPGLR